MVRKYLSSICPELSHPKSISDFINKGKQKQACQNCFRSQDRPKCLCEYNTNCPRNTFANDIPEKECVHLPFIPGQVTQNSFIPFGRIILWTLVSDVYVDRSHSCIAPSLFVLFIPCLRQVRRQCYVFTNFSMFDPCPLMQTQPSTAQATFREHDLHHKLTLASVFPVPGSWTGDSGRKISCFHFATAAFCFVLMMPCLRHVRGLAGFERRRDGWMAGCGDTQHVYRIWYVYICILSNYRLLYVMTRQGSAERFMFRYLGQVGLRLSLSHFPSPVC